MNSTSAARTESTVQATDEQPGTEPLTAESLIEEVSIDGMCGVY